MMMDNRFKMETALSVMVSPHHNKTGYLINYYLHGNDVLWEVCL
jgi:hypothetical protein